MEKLLALEQYLQSPEFTEGSAVRLIMSDIYKSNQFLQIGTVIANVQKFQDNYGSLALLSIVLLGSLSTVAIYKFKKSKIALVLGELSAVFMVGIIYYIPFKGVRFIAGLHFFACFLSIHSRICAILQTKQGTESQSETGKSESPASNKDVPKSWVRDTLGFAAEAFMTFFYNLLPKLGNLGHSKFPSIGRLLNWFSLSILTDLALYGMKEWIPANMHAQNQYFAISVVGGIWVLLSMDWAYCNFIIVFDIMGHPVPTELRHRHPLLSTSLSEFWGYRWNPVIGKLLQDSFYKPLRRVGVPRIVCILACFTGSALLHAIPQIISTQDVLDAAMMFGFFFLQGVLLLLELLFLKFMRWDKETTLSTNNSSENLSSIANETTAHRHDVLKKVNWQWAAESLLVLAVLTTLYCTLESLFTFETVAAIFFLCIGAVISFCYVQYEIILRKNDLTEWNYSRTDQNIALLKKLMYLVGGWIWVWGSVIAILPLFSVPVVHAFDDMYRNSILIGSLVRASQYILVNYAHLAQADPHTIANSASVANLQSALEHIAAAEL